MRTAGPWLLCCVLSQCVLWLYPIAVLGHPLGAHCQLQCSETHRNRKAMGRLNHTLGRLDRDLLNRSLKNTLLLSYKDLTATVAPHNKLFSVLSFYHSLYERLLNITQQSWVPSIFKGMEWRELEEGKATLGDLLNRYRVMNVTCQLNLREESLTKSNKIESSFQSKSHYDSQSVSMSPTFHQVSVLWTHLVSGLRDAIATDSIPTVC